MSADLTYAKFAEYLNASFQIQSEVEIPLALDLIEVKHLSPPREQSQSSVRKEPFSLLFRGPQGLALPQSTYELQHQTFGKVVLFMVPVAEDDEGRYYEAIFT